MEGVLDSLAVTAAVLQMWTGARAVRRFDVSSKIHSVCADVPSRAESRSVECAIATSRHTHHLSLPSFPLSSTFRLRNKKSQPTTSFCSLYDAFDI